MSDPIMDHCNGPVSWDHYIHVHRIHEWQRLRGLGGEEKDGTEEWERLRGFGGEEKMALKKVMFVASLRDAFPFQNG